MYSSVSKLDRDVARAFLNAPSNSVSYIPMLMKNKSNQKMLESSPLIYKNENFSDNNVLPPPPHPNAQLGYPKNQTIIPMYYDLIIDTVTDYDIFYPIAKQTEKHYYVSNTNENSNYPRDDVQRLDELAVSMDFPNDYSLTPQCSNHSMQDQDYPIRTARFPNNPMCISSTRNNIEQSFTPSDQYYFYPDNERSIKTPFFWFRPVVDQNYAICIPTTRPSLHAYVTPLFDLRSISNSIRL